MKRQKYSDELAMVGLGIALPFALLAQAETYRQKGASESNGVLTLSDPSFHEAVTLGLLGIAFISLGLLSLRILRSPPTMRLIYAGFSVSVTLPVVFAAVYTAASRSGSCITSATDVWDYTYFSYVAFTTVGFGDLQSLGICRAVAASEAITGYLALGAFVGVAVSFFQSDKND